MPESEDDSNLKDANRIIDIRYYIDETKTYTNSFRAWKKKDRHADKNKIYVIYKGDGDGADEVYALRDLFLDGIAPTLHAWVEMTRKRHYKDDERKGIFQVFHNLVDGAMGVLS